MQEEILILTGICKNFQKQPNYPQESIIILDPKASLPLPPQSDDQPKETDSITYL